MGKDIKDDNPPCLRCGLRWPECGCYTSKQKKIINKSKSKDSTRLALEAYYKKIDPAKLKRKNKHPEKDVEKECVPWMKSQGWDVQIYEAKNTFNPRTQSWTSKSMQAGTVDCQGLLPSGRFVAIEFKAPGRMRDFRCTKNTRQQKYLTEKIYSNAFGCVTDSLERLKDIYIYWASLPDDGERVAYLLKMLP